MSEYKFPCGAVRDLLPLYRDNVCGEESRRIVEEHLAECEECSKMLEFMTDSSVEEMLFTETNTVLKKHRKKERRKAVTAGLITAGILFVPLIVCLICNLASGNGLSWFYIVMTSLLTAASITVVPMLSTEYKFPKTVAAFTISLFLLLLSVCVYTKGDWLWIAAVPSIFGISVFCAPFVVRGIALPEFLKNRKTSLVLLWDVLWLYLTLAVCCIYTNGSWFMTTAIACTFGLSAVILPIVIRQLPLPAPFKNHKALIVMLWETAWLYAVILDCAKYSPDIGNYFHNSLWITSLCILLPWTVFVLIRYAKLHILIKIGLCVLLPSLFEAAVNDIIMMVWLPRGGVYTSSVLRTMLGMISGETPVDTASLITAIVFESLIALGVILIVIGIVLVIIKNKHRGKKG